MSSFSSIGRACGAVILFCLTWACSGNGGGSFAPGGDTGAGRQDLAAGGPVGGPAPANAVPGAPSGEIGTKFDPTGNPEFRIDSFQVKFCQVGEAWKYLASGVLNPLPNAADPSCNQRVIRAIDSARYLYSESATASTGECKFDIALSTSAGEKAEWKFYVGEKSVSLTAQGVTNSFDPSNLLVVNGFSPALGPTVEYNPDLSYFASQDCPTAASLSSGDFRLRTLPSTLNWTLPSPPEEDGDDNLLEAK